QTERGALQQLGRLKLREQAALHEVVGEGRGVLQIGDRDVLEGGLQFRLAQQGAAHHTLHELIGRRRHGVFFREREAVVNCESSEVNALQIENWPLQIEN